MRDQCQNMHFPRRNDDPVTGDREVAPHVLERVTREWLGTRMGSLPAALEQRETPAPQALCGPQMCFTSPNGA